LQASIIGKLINGSSLRLLKRRERKKNRLQQTNSNENFLTSNLLFRLYTYFYRRRGKVFLSFLKLGKKELHFELY